MQVQRPALNRLAAVVWAMHEAFLKHELAHYAIPWWPMTGSAEAGMRTWELLTS